MAKIENINKALKLYGELTTILNDIIEHRRLTEADLPDDFRALAIKLGQCNIAEEGLRRDKETMQVDFGLGEMQIIDTLSHRMARAWRASK